MLYSRNSVYTLHNQPLSVVVQVTYLGVDISSTLSWSPHINKICSKASQSLGFLKRNIHSSKPCTKAAAYNSIVRPTLEYCSSVWDPYHQKDIDKIENVQRQAARFVANNYSKTPGTVSNIIQDLKWNSLQSRRQQFRLILFYKIVYEHVDINISNYLIPYNRQTRLHHHMAYQIPISTVDYHKFSFFPRTVAQWNTLPSYVVSADTIPGFKSALVASVFHP